MAALYALRVQCLAGNPRAIPLYNLLVKDQTAGCAVQDCVTLYHISSPSLPTLFFSTRRLPPSCLHVLVHWGLRRKQPASGLLKT